MKKKVWIFNHYAEPPQYETRIRNNAMAKYLMRAGYDVTIFGASTIHNTEINLITDGSPYIRREYDGLKFVHINVPGYSGNGLSRKLNLLAFPYRLWKYTRQLRETPDVIINDLDVMAMNFPFLIARRYRVPIITEVRDLWPESIIAYGLLKRESLLAKFLYFVEKRMYQKSDAVVFTMEGGYDYICERGWEKLIPQSKVFYINNGVDLELFMYNRDHFHTEDADLDNPELFKVIYTGSIRHVNNIGLLLDAAKLVTDSRVKFLIWGDGDERAKLEQRVKTEKISNVSFKGTVEKRYIPDIVTRSDLNLAHNTPSELFRFGISFNKLFDYLAAGKPILCDFFCRYDIVKAHHAGVSTGEPTSSKIAEAIDALAKSTPEETAQLCENVKACAQEFDYQNLTNKMIQLIES
jgi:glycosyltransferase involved in cell wall biosynthesis